MVAEKRILSRKDGVILLKAAEEIDRYGHTEITCPLCGGELQLDMLGTSYTIRCEREGCAELTSRGI